MATFQTFDQDNDVIKNQRTVVSSGIFSGGSGTMTSFYSQSAQGASTGSYIDVYHQDPTAGSATVDTAEIQFSLGYAHYWGSGSAGNTTKLNTGGRQTAALYRQFANVILPAETSKFTFTGAESASDDFYFVTFQRARQREKIDPGNWELHLSGSGATSTLKLIDDSGATTNPTVNEGGRVFNIISGSIATGTAITNTTAANQPGGAYGLFYPDLGIILLHPSVLEASGSLKASRTSDTYGDNPHNFFLSVATGSKFQVRREEEISSTNYFCRVNNQKFNFSNNPTFSDTNGDFTQGTFFKDPKTFITQVGLYNENNDLLAVAKLSKPVLKSYSREAIIKVKLDF
mgnify:FL=1